MKKKSIIIIVGLMSIALLGVVTMQLYFLMQSYTLQSKLFDRSVHEALSDLVAKVDKQDYMNYLNARARNQIQQQGSFSYTSIKTTIAVTHGTSKGIKKRLTSREWRIAKLRDSLQHMIANREMDDKVERLIENNDIRLQIRVDAYTDELGEHIRYTPEIKTSPKSSDLSQKPHKLHKFDTVHFVVHDPQLGTQLLSSIQINPEWQRDQARKQAERQFRLVQRMLAEDSLAKLKKGQTQSTVIANLAEEYQNINQPLKRRINYIWLDSLLRFELHDHGITLPVSYEILTNNNDSLIFSKAMDTVGVKPKFISADTYQTTLFPKDVLRDPGKIRITFPQKNSFILGSMTASLATTGGLIAVLIFCFGYTIFSIIRQKKISEMKTDFINNMTHEFKTPVSTIMIASEALRDPEIVADRSRVSRLANVIYEENARLGIHIERVLNVARIEKNDFKLEKRPLDVNEMINIVIDSMALKLQKHDVKLTLQLDAVNAVVLADELHFSNIIYNLVDNAIKYSNGTPDITISSANRGDQILIRVADKGIGMSRDQQTKIFEQFYRIPTGNLHDVKGFGLGLSYVNTIVKRLNGAISVRSEKDKGSDFELRFPLA